MSICTEVVVVILQNAACLTLGIDLLGVSHKHAVSMRRYVLKQLIDAATVPSEHRDVCDAAVCCNSDPKPTWVCCDVCGRWCHLCCVGLTCIPCGDYVCSICQSSYAWVVVAVCHLLSLWHAGVRYWWRVSSIMMSLFWCCCISLFLSCYLVTFHSQYSIKVPLWHARVRCWWCVNSIMMSLCWCCCISLFLCMSFMNLSSVLLQILFSNWISVRCW